MAAIPRLKPYAGPALLSYGFRPFFLLGSIWAGIEVLAWLPMFYGELSLATAFSPRDWHVHELLFGSIPAIVAGFLLTAIPIGPGGYRCGAAAGRVGAGLGLQDAAPSPCPPVSVGLGATVVDCAFLVLMAAAVVREILAGKNWKISR